MGGSRHGSCSRAYADDLSGRGWLVGERLEAYQTLTYWWARDRLTDTQALVKLKALLARKDHECRGFAPETAESVKQGMLVDLPKRMAQLRREGVDRLGIGHRGNPPTDYPLAVVRMRGGWRDDALGTLTASDDARIDAAIQRSGLAVLPIQRRALALLVATIQRAAVDCDGTAIPVTTFEKITGGKYWVCPVSGERRKSKTVLRVLAQHLGLLGEIRTQASRHLGIARVFSLPMAA